MHSLKRKLKSAARMLSQCHASFSIGMKHRPQLPAAPDIGTAKASPGGTGFDHENANKLGARFPAARLSRQINGQCAHIAAKSPRDLAQREE